VPLIGRCLLGKFKCYYYTFFLTFINVMLWLWKWNWVGSWMGWGWINENFEVLCGLCYVRREPRLWLSAIMWITRPCVAYSTEFIMKCLNVLSANPLPFMPLSFILRVRVSLKKKVFVVVTNSSHNYERSMAYFNYTNTISEWTC